MREYQQSHIMSDDGGDGVPMMQTATTASDVLLALRTPKDMIIDDSKGEKK